MPPRGSRSPPRCSDPIKNLTGSSNIPILEESYKSLTLATILGEYHQTRGTNRQTKQKISDLNIYNSSYITSVKGLDPLKENSEDLHLPLEEGIKLVVKSAKAINSNSWRYLT